DPSKVIDIELTGHMIAVNNQKDSVSPLPVSGKKNKVSDCDSYLTQVTGS
ncbi:hypothetical protein Tco_1463212, partial [Tanacetum coccineum]